ncbi:hypothetical protein ACELLULO517_07740 [Acidisoma cellulosilytica]|uniref:Uncharacterized protein n=1 Tax=Acidisoma cellulosilyticum TaxID=2802395 RepID=A0A963YZP4_9PROT|nr:hypothetical protein [Acidisoma cellulosilyticum]MCB8880123.1 hypothetical protein [Acidisoma cellulosilyticum]
MANILAPFGFRWFRELTGVAPNCAQSVRKILSTNTTAIFHGDPVTSQSSGYIQQAAPGTTQIAGIFVGCRYLSKSMGRTVWNNYYPGADANGDVEAYIIDDPNAVFAVQANGGPVVLADVGQNANFAIGTGNTLTGMSAASLDFSTVATTGTLPFRIIGYGGATGFTQAGPGSDPTTAYNYAYVTFNNQDFKVLTGV